MPDYKQLCVELLSELENAIQVIYREDGTRHISGAYPVINKVKSALAEKEPDIDTILRLAAIIREVDGSNNLGAAALAEAIISHPNNCWGK